MTSLEAACQSAAVTPADIRQAADRIAPYVRETPIFTSSGLDKYLSSTGTAFFLKAENFQKTGSFKYRGATNGILTSKGREPVVCFSTGNHAQALAEAATRAGRDVHVVMPNTAPQVKIDAVEAYGGKVTTCSPSAEHGPRVAAKLCRDVGGVMIHSFKDAVCVAGQGTVGVELMRQVPDLDAIIAPIGGGGLISGVAIIAKSIRPDIKIIGAEPEQACSAAKSMRAGSLVQEEGVLETRADGLKCGIGELGWGVIKRLVDAIITVTEEDIATDMKFVWQRMKLVIEPSSAVGIAAARSDEFRRMGFGKVGIILCGGNVDLDNLPW